MPSKSIYRIVDMCGMTIQENLPALAPPRILNYATRYGLTCIEVLYLSRKELTVKIFIAIYGNAILDLLRT